MPQRLAHARVASRLPHWLAFQQATFSVKAAAKGCLTGCLCLAILTGCDNEPDVTTYTVPQEKSVDVAALLPVSMNQNMPGMSGAGPMANQPAGPQSTQGTQLSWSTPSGWKEERGNTQFRVATLTPQGGTENINIAITHITNDRSDLLSNVNRWRGQIGLAPVGPDEAKAAVQPLNQTGLQGQYLDLQGRDDRMVVAWFTFPDGAWYFKLTGDRLDVDNNEPTMRQFARSIKKIGPGTPPKDTTPEAGDAEQVDREVLASDLLDQPETTEHFHVAIGGDPEAIHGEMPGTWTRQPNAQMLLAVFDTASGARVTISRFPGNVGGREANIGRWVRQLGMTNDQATINRRHFLIRDVPVDVYEILPKDISAETAQDAKTMLTATIRDADNTYFIKLTGSAIPVSQEIGTYLYFLDQLQLPLVQPLPQEGWQ